MLRVTVVEKGPDAKLTLEGSLDMSTGDVLRDTVGGLDIDDLTSLTFSIGGLELIDSTGIGQLIGYHRLLRQRQGRVYIENDNREIEEILELIGVREILEP
ncbi:MAG TPA: STAS domain-containing protein [Firmicutes bacterium]|nr:STAS domain-containing protein [Bacillota bacterium]